MAAALGRFEGEETAFRRWLFTIARRRVVDLRRRDARARAALAPLAGSIDPPHVADPESVALAACEKDVALARIAQLPSDQAEVVALRVLAGLSVADVAAIVGKQPGAIRVIQHRALKRLAEELAAERGRAVTQ